MLRDSGNFGPLFSEQRWARASGNSTSVPGKGRKTSLKVFKGKSTYLNVSSKRLKISLSCSPATKSDLMNIQCTKSGGEGAHNRMYFLFTGRSANNWVAYKLRGGGLKRQRYLFWFSLWILSGNSREISKFRQDALKGTKAKAISNSYIESYFIH